MSDLWTDFDNWGQAPYSIARRYEGLATLSFLTVAFLKIRMLLRRDNFATLDAEILHNKVLIPLNKNNKTSGLAE